MSSWAFDPTVLPDILLPQLQETDRRFNPSANSGCFVTSDTMLLDELFTTVYVVFLVRVTHGDTRIMLSVVRN